ncbi:MAG: SH3 domain-containing protein [Chloroflexi bacterium]|nr:SH3 domain-containing protein [Chloroflexota bacterium]
MLRGRFILIMLALLLVGQAALPAAAQGLWTAEYFNNPYLQGTPAAIFSEGSPAHNWGAGSPNTSLPADYFSVRWTSAQTLAAGTYQLTVRADDGVRVLVDGLPYIDEWHTASGGSYTTTLNLTAGTHTFLVEFYEAAGLAFLEYSFGSVVPGGATATVNTGMLNVRAAPNPFTGAILTRITRGQMYTVIGRNADTSWLQLDVNGISGWVNARYVVAVNVQNVPVTDPGTRPTGATATVITDALNVRAAPNPFTGAILTRIRLGETYSVIGRNADSSWIQLNVNGVTGWVNRSYTVVVGLDHVPVTDPGTRPTGATATVITDALNVRAAPNPFTGAILTRITRGQMYTVIGRNADTSWLQLDVNGIIDWVNARYVLAANLANVPITG